MPPRVTSRLNAYRIRTVPNPPRPNDAHDPETNDPPASQQAAEFARLAARPEPGLLREFWDFLRTNKNGWLTPIIVVLLLVAIMAALAATGAPTILHVLLTPAAAIVR